MRWTWNFGIDSISYIDLDNDFGKKHPKYPKAKGFCAYLWNVSQCKWIQYEHIIMNTAYKTGKTQDPIMRFPPRTLTIVKSCFTWNNHKPSPIWNKHDWDKNEAASVYTNISKDSDIIQQLKVSKVKVKRISWCS